MIDRRPGLIAALRRRRRRHRRRRTRARARAAGVDPRRRAQRRRPGRRRRRAVHRPLASCSGVHVDPKAETILAEGGCTWGDVDHAAHAVRADRAVRDHLDDRRRRPDARRRHRPPVARRYGLSIDNLLARRPGARRRQLRHRERRPSTPTCSGRCAAAAATSASSPRSSSAARRSPAIMAGPTFWPIEQRGRGAALLRRASSPTRPDELNGFFAFLVVPPGRAVPGRAARPEGVRRDLVLDRLAGRRRPGVRAGARLRAADRRRHRAAPMPALNSAFDALYPPGHAVVLEGRLRRRADRRGDRPPRRARLAAADDALDDAPVPDRPRGRRGSRRTTPRSRSAARAGRR